MASCKTYCCMFAWWIPLLLCCCIGNTSGMPTPIPTPSETLTAYTQMTVTEVIYVTKLVDGATQQGGLTSIPAIPSTSKTASTSKATSTSIVITDAPDIPEPEEPQIAISGSTVLIRLDDLPPSVRYVTPANKWRNKWKTITSTLQDSQLQVNGSENIGYVYIIAQPMKSTRRKRQEPDEKSFIVANLTRTDIENGASNFTLGDNQIYGGYKNTVLEDGEEYSVMVGYAICKEQGCKVVWSKPSTFTAPATSSSEGPAVVAIVLGILLPLIIIAIVFLIFIFWRWRKKRQFKEKPPIGTPPPKPPRVNEGFFDEDGFEEIELNDVIYNDIKSFKWDIFWSDLRLTKRVLGQGHFGEVRLGGVRIQNKWIKSAVKILKDGSPDYDNAKTEVHAEVKAMTKINLHPNVINVLGICEHKGNVYAAMEFAPHGSLRRFLRENRKDPNDANQNLIGATRITNLNSEQLMNIAIGVAKGMQHLQQNGIIHRDLAARNILVGKNMVPKVANFAKPHGKQLAPSQRDPLRWLSVESLQMRIYTGKSDSWSFGIVLWEIATLGGTPYPDMETKFLNFHLNNGYRMPKPDTCDGELFDIMRQCWKENPESRPSFKDIVFDLNLMASMKKEYLHLKYEKGFKFVPIRPERDNS